MIRIMRAQGFRGLLSGLLACCLICGLPGISCCGEQRIVALGGPATEIVCLLGLEDSLVARTAWTNWPPAVRGLPHVGAPASPNLEVLLHLHPSIVLADAHYAGMREKLAPYGIRVELFSAYTGDSVIPAIRKLGALLGRQKRAEECVEQLSAIFRMLDEPLRTLPADQRLRCLMLAGTNSYFSFSDNSGRFFLQKSGLLNICGPMRAAYPFLNREWILRSTPDVLLLVPDEQLENTDRGWLGQVYEEFAKSPLRGFVRTGSATRVLVMNGPFTYGLRQFFGRLFLARTVYPRRMAQIDPDQVYREFCQRFFHLDVGENSRQWCIYP